MPDNLPKSRSYERCDPGETRDPTPWHANMGRIKLNYVIDVAILLSGALCGITGVIKWPGLISSLGLSYQALPFEPITLIHDWAGLAAIAFAALHVLLHGKWLAAMTKKLLKRNGDNNETA